MVKGKTTSKEIQKDIRAILNKGHKWKGNILQFYAEKFDLQAIPEEELYKNDMTELYLKELKRQIKNKEIVKNQINGKTRLSKSTIGIYLGWYLFEVIKEEYPEYVGEKEFGVRNIARDEQERIRLFRNPKLMYDVIVTDERNAMDETGENVTVEKAQKEMFSDIQAGRYISEILISPEKVIDDNADIRLVVRNKQDGFTHCRLYYNLRKGGFSSWRLLGYVDFDVRKLIKNWQRIEKKFMRFLVDDYVDYKQKEKDYKVIEYWRKRDFYVEYMCRKYEKIELMNKEGIQRERELDYADVYLSVLNETRNLTGIMSIQNLKRVTNNFLENELRKRKIPYSMIGIANSTERVMSVLSMYSTLHSINKQIKQIERIILKKGDSDGKMVKNIEDLRKAGEQILNAIKVQESEWERYVLLNKQYHKIK